MTTFADHQHPRANDGRFTTKDHPEAEIELDSAPVGVTLAIAIGDWGGTGHDKHIRPVTAYSPSDRAAAELRRWYGAAETAPVAGEYISNAPGNGALRIRVDGGTGANFPGPTREAAEANMLSVLDRVSGRPAPWRRADPVQMEEFEEIFDTVHMRDYRWEHLRPAWMAEDAEEGFRAELVHMHRSLAGNTVPTACDIDAVASRSFRDITEDFASTTAAGRIVRDPQKREMVRGPVAGNLAGRCYAVAQVLNRNEDTKAIRMTAGVLEDFALKDRDWSQVQQHLAMHVGEHRRGRTA